MCQDCKIAQENHEYTMFNPACLYCGARLIQRLASLDITKADLHTRRKAVLDDWEKFGHKREQIRELAKGPICTGPARVAESGDPLKSNKRKRKHETRRHHP